MRPALVPTALATLLGVAAATPAAAQGRYQQQILSEIARYTATARQQGYGNDRDLVQGSLDDDESESLRINLTGGVRYVIVGVCDEDCSDIDLRIYSPDGTKIDEDIALDDYPTLQFVAPVTGVYRLSIEMANCSTNPCYWGVQVLSR